MRQAWGADADYRPRTHEDTIEVRHFEGAQIVYVDIAPPNDELIELADVAAQIILLDHHVSSRDRVEADLRIDNAMAGGGHDIRFDLDYSGAVLAWQYFQPDEPVPDLLRYVQDQDLWSWKLPRSQEVNAAIGSYPFDFETWDELARRDIHSLADEGEPLVRSKRTEVERALHSAAPIVIQNRRIEAINASDHRSSIGHELAKRALFGEQWGCVYRITGHRVSATLYSIGDFNVAEIATSLGGGGHKNAAGFNVSLSDWQAMLL